MTKRSTARPADSDEHYRGLFENQHTVMLIYDPQTFDIVDVNSAACRFYGYPRAQLTALKITDFGGLPPAQAKKTLREAHRTDRQPHLLKHRLANGEIRDVEVYAGPIELRGQTYQCAIVHDITRRQQAEEELRRERNFVSAVLDTIGALVVVLDREGRIVRFNRMCERVTGYSFADVKHRQLWEFLLTADEIGPVRGIFEKLRAGDFPLNFENFWITKDGRWRLIAWSNTTLANDDGRIEYVIGTGVDVTEQRQAEAQLRHSNAELQTRNAELDAFAHTVAHDIKNPLHLIIGYTELLSLYSNRYTSADKLEILQAVQSQARKLNDITDNLLLLAEVRQNAFTLRPLDMDAIVTEVRQRLIDQLDDQVEVRQPSLWPNALGYAPWVEEVWMNYLSNALKYMNRPGCIELGAAPIANGQICFWVHDDGIGVPPEEQAQLFTAFFQTSRAKRGGHGLGLSIVKRIIERLGGTVSVESSGIPGEGSTFSFTLPAA